jgi:hypothetical protein
MPAKLRCFVAMALVKKTPTPFQCFESKASPWPVVTRLADGQRRRDYAAAAGSVTVPGVTNAASVAVSRYVWGSMPTSFADSHSV